MVCLGNICRSPMAEGILQDMAWKAGLDWSVESAGTNGYHDGESPHRLSRKVALMNGIDIGGQRSRRFRSQDMDDFDRIYAMAKDVGEEIRHIAGRRFNESKVSLLMDELHPGRGMDVPDPFYGGEEGYHQCFQMMSEACGEIVRRHLENEKTSKR